MDAKEYHKQAMRTAAGLSREEQIINAILGLIGEVGEIAQDVDTLDNAPCDVSQVLCLAELLGGLADSLKKHLYHGHSLDSDFVSAKYEAIKVVAGVGRKGLGNDSRYGMFCKCGLKEVGDVTWYAALACEAQGATIDDAMQISINSKETHGRE